MRPVGEAKLQRRDDPRSGCSQISSICQTFLLPFLSASLLSSINNPGEKAHVDGVVLQFLVCVLVVPGWTRHVVGQA